MMKHYLFALAAGSLLLAACNRTPETPAEDAAAPATADAPAQDMAATDPAADAMAGTDVVSAVDHGSPAGDNQAFDVKAFAGTYAAEGTSLTIDAAGGYQLTVHAESADADLASSGTWTLEDDGQHILLDPEDKSGTDRRFQIVGSDELRAVDGGQTLRRGG
jgi:hypothetical protein